MQKGAANDAESSRKTIEVIFWWVFPLMILIPKRVLLRLTKFRYLRRTNFQTYWDCICRLELWDVEYRALGREGKQFPLEALSEYATDTDTQRAFGKAPEEERVVKKISKAKAKRLRRLSKRR